MGPELGSEPQQLLTKAVYPEPDLAGAHFNPWNSPGKGFTGEESEGLKGVKPLPEVTRLASGRTGSGAQVSVQLPPQPQGRYTDSSIYPQAETGHSIQARPALALGKPRFQVIES